jgi:hypothetical protein
MNTLRGAIKQAVSTVEQGAFSITPLAHWTFRHVTQKIGKRRFPLPDGACFRLWWFQADSCSFMPIRMVLSDFAGFTLLEVADVIGLRSVWRREWDSNCWFVVTYCYLWSCANLLI